MGIRVVVVDDNPHVSWQGRVYPVNATFHRFLSAVLSVPGSPVASIAHAVPLRPATEAPRTLPLDERLIVAGTEPFDGIAGFLRRSPAITSRNAPILRAALAEADLLWLKVPASNALLATWLARRARVPRFIYVAGSALDVVAGQQRGLVSGLAARAVAAAYDGIGRIVAVGGQRVVVGEGLVDGGGIVTSLVEPGEIHEPRGSWPREPGRLHLAWAGRLAAGKGIETLLDALARLDGSVTLDLLGDGPARGELESRARALGLVERVTFAGYVAERAPYLDRLAAADLFVFPSPAEGFPKVILDAMAVGLPVVATPSGELTTVGRERLELVPPRDPSAIAHAIGHLTKSPERAQRLRSAGIAFAGAHTRPAEAERLVASWRRRWPSLPWDEGPRSL